jgi:transmembrane sensor
MTESDFTPELPAGTPDWEAIARHLTGESSAAESAAVVAWLSAHPDEARAFAEIVESSAQLRAVAAVDVESALTRVHERMRQAGMPVIPLRPAARSARRAYAAWGLAAAAVVLFAVGILRPRRDVAPAATRMLATSVGEVDSTRLEDGTRVVLGPLSELRIDARYADGRREVELRGTAFFAVTHDTRHPFTVRTHGVVITDLGTKFTVRGDGADGVDVSVTEGAVRVQADGGPRADLRAGDRAMLASSGALDVQRAIDSEEDAAWTRGRIVFREAPVSRVRSELRRWYGVEFLLTDSTLASRHLTAAFTKETRQQVLDVIALALGASYDVRGDTVILRPSSLRLRPRE